jgi:hypothetical protein
VTTPSGVFQSEVVVHRLTELLFAAEKPQLSCSTFALSGLDLAIKEEILAKTTPINAKKKGRYRPDDDLLTFLKGL